MKPNLSRRLRCHPPRGRSSHTRAVVQTPQVSRPTVLGGIPSTHRRDGGCCSGHGWPHPWGDSLPSRFPATWLVEQKPHQRPSLVARSIPLLGRLGSGGHFHPSV